jgi:hypothetical protein
MADQKDSRLFSLPPELRKIIYGMVFEGCILELRRNDAKRSPESVGLLLACKQTFKETINLYYCNVTVESPMAVAIINWVRRLPHQHSYLIPEIKLIAMFNLYPPGQILVRHMEERLAKLPAILSKEGIVPRSRLALEIRSRKTVEMVCTAK